MNTYANAQDVRLGRSHSAFLIKANPNGAKLRVRKIVITGKLRDTKKDFVSRFDRVSVYIGRNSTRAKPYPRLEIPKRIA